MMETEFENYITDYNIKSDTEELIRKIQQITSCTALRKIKKELDELNLELIKGNYVFSIRKNSHMSIFDVTLLDGRKISDIRCSDNIDNLPTEVQENCIKSLLSETGKLITALDERIRLAEFEEKKFEKSMKFYGIVAAIIAVLVLAIEFFDNI